MSASSALLHDFASSFKDLLPSSILSKLISHFSPRGGGKPKSTLEQLIKARVFHEIKRSGTFSHNFSQITGTFVSDSALSQRLQSVGFPLFEAILPAVLKPIAKPNLHPAAFYHGYRLTATDGVRFNLKNTPAMKRGALKNPCAKGNGEPAFAQLRAVVLLELGHHQPLGASMGWQQEGEQTLFRKLFSTTSLPEKSLPPHGVTTRCHHTVSPHGVTTRCHHTVSPHGVTTRCHHTVSPHGVTTRCHHTVSPHGTTRHHTVSEKLERPFWTRAIELL